MNPMANLSSTKKTLITILVIPVVILLIVLFCLGIINRPKDLPIQEKLKPDRPSQGVFSGAKLDLEDFTFTEYAQTDKGTKKTFELCGKKLQTKSPKIGIFRVAIGKVVELENPRINFYKDDLLISIASSKTGAMNYLNKGIKFYGNVGLITKDTRTLSCNQLEWNNEQKYLLAEGDCVLKSEGRTVKAEAIKTDVELSNFNANGEKNRLLKTVTKILGGAEK